MSINLTSRTLLTSLFNTISSLPPSSTPSKPGLTAFSTESITANTLRHFPPKTRNLFLTAHCLLPTTFLAALDLLEKQLVVRCMPQFQSTETADLEVEGDEPAMASVYYIRSS